jgi:hypothetical protein
MRARIVPASNGVRWLGEGFQMFRAAPLGWLSLVFVYLFGTQIVALVPYVGVAVALLAVPGLTLGLMGAARAASHGAGLRVAMLFEGFRNGLRGQLVLGAVYLACSLVIFAAMSFADEDGAVRAALSGRGAPEDVDAGDWASAGAALALLYAPVMMMFWFAPALAAWHTTGAAKALFFSFFACLINWRAFLAYGAVTALAMVVLPLAAISLPLALFGGDKVKMAPLVLPLLVLSLPTLFASFYASYRDVFAVEAGAENERA